MSIYPTRERFPRPSYLRWTGRILRPRGTSRQSVALAATILLLLAAVFAAPLHSPMARADQGNPVATPGVEGASGTQDPLWQKAVALAERNENWIPGLAIQRIENMDGDWQVKDYEEYWIRITPDSSGGLHRELVKAIEDGEDRTAEEREKAEKERRQAEERRHEQEERRRREAEERGEAYVPPEEDERYQIFGAPLPFDAEIQDSITVQRIDAPDPPPAPPSVAFEFTQTLDDESALHGTVWLDAETGAPIEARFAPEPPPGRVKEIEMRMRFTSGPGSTWYPTELFIRAMGKFLFFKKRVQTTLTLSEYWWKEENDG